MDKHLYSRQNTKTRILIAASRVFSEKGYENTTVQDICTACDANIAAVNYHYKSKENLYQTVWTHLYKINEETNKELFRDDLDPELQLRQFVSNRIKSTMDEGELAYLSKLISYELNSPSSSYEYLFETYIEERCNWILNLINRLSGKTLPESSLAHIFFFINSPIIRLNDHLANKATNDIDEDEMIENMYNYILGGIKHICSTRTK
ncbi:transcriptional regulator, TetR family protein [Lentisphaera araneosa HTCC2155]|jgi:TetR/AcrR family transcriptional regulator, regulator of cefoperazone and chloramphenicol sensitivity|uniref:Transcriptional regulator, TetR family protein n=1 Tax=Lentisphaera araneosa HTCC2155 TaxID=313628 RepID=A6DLP3_9BACT|nr:TetR/AcrR family transcriptional regulator [Lentisphaera araneosa]EDM27498.1 transcriptional regulator, TetR family protein [Lentisphaera araneosa HTCC2155]